MKFSEWVLEPDKYLSKEQASRLLKTVEHRAELAKVKNQKTAIRDYFVIHLALSTGLRVMEIAALNCGDLFLNERLCSVLVRRGKGGKKKIGLFYRPVQKTLQTIFKMETAAWRIFGTGLAVNCFNKHRSSYDNTGITEYF